MGAREGGWVVLQNLHHALAWLPTLSDLIIHLFTAKTQSRNTSTTTLSPFFRLILTTEPTDKFPVSLLRGVEKMFIDNPGDAKQALQEATAALTRYTSNLQFTDEEEEAEIATCRLLHGLSVFHTVVSERRRHGHLAWSYPPAFTMADFTLTISAVTSSLEVNGEVDPEEVEYLVSQVFYGGRVHRKEDQRIITSILKQVMALSLCLPEENETSPHTDDTPVPHQLNAHTAGEEDDVGLSLLFPDYFGKLEDLQDFVKGVGGLEKPEVFGLPAGVQHLQEMESGHRFLTTLATVGGTHTLPGTTENSVTQELLAHMKKMPKPIPGMDELNLCDDKDLAELLKREVKLLNSALDTITGSLDAAAQLTTGAVSWSNRSEEVIAEVMVGHTPAAWLHLCPNPAPPQLHHFMDDLHAKTNFFKNWMEKGCPPQFWLGAFQFLPAFLVTLLRKGAQLSNHPLHHCSWSFRFTDIPLDTHPVSYSSEETVCEENDNPSSEDCICEINDDNPNAVNKNGTSADYCGESEVFERNEKNIDQVSKVEQHNLGLNTEKSKQIWNDIGQTGLLVSGLWLFGASWNSTRYELEEPSSLELMEQLPVLSMVPTTEGDNSGNRATKTSICNSECSSPHTQHCGTMNDVSDESFDQHLQYKASDNPSNLDTISKDGQETALCSEEKQKIGVDWTFLDFQPDDDMIGSSRSEGLSTVQSGCYECPVYEGGPSTASKLPVLTIPLPAGSKGENYWIQRRVAIYLNKN